MIYARPPTQVNPGAPRVIERNWEAITQLYSDFIRY